MDEWISVENELPKPNTDVLVMARKCNIRSYLPGPIDRPTVAYWMPGSGWTETWCGNRVVVTWWMPMPELPKEEEPHEIKAYRLDEPFPDD